MKQSTQASIMFITFLILTGLHLILGSDWAKTFLICTLISGVTIDINRGFEDLKR